MCSESPLRLAPLFGRVLCLLLLAAMASGCATRLLYNNLERVVVWRTGDYVDLDRAQRDWLRTRVRIHLAWHRQHQLPQWAAQLRRFEAEIRDDGLSEASLDGFYANGLGWSREILQEIAPTGAELLRALSDAQLEGLPEAFAESNRKLNEDYEGLTPEAQRDVWRQEAEDGLEDWLGRLTGQQQLLLEATASEIEPDNLQWIGYRRRWQAELLHSLALRADATWFDATFYTLVKHRPAFYGPDYAAVRARNDEAYRAFLLALTATLTDAQRERLADRLAGLAEDFEFLAGQQERVPEDPGPAPRG